jgi:AcrR family transcriptional regulator
MASRSPIEDGLGSAPASQGATSNEDRRAALLDAAVQLFATRPYDEIFVSEIATAAGVANGLVYYYFDDKRGIYLEVMRLAQAELLRLGVSVEYEASPADRIRGFIRRVGEYRRTHPQVMLAMTRLGRDPEIDELAERTRRGAVRHILGLIGVEGEPPPLLRTAMRGFLGYADELFERSISNEPDVSPEQFEEMVLEIVAASLAESRIDRTLGMSQILDELRDDRLRGRAQ